MEILNQKIEDQNRNIQEIIEEEKHSQEEISRLIDEEMNKLVQNIKNLDEINSKKLIRIICQKKGHKVWNILH